MKSAHVLAAAVAAALAAPTPAGAGPPAAKPAFAAEKCYGINVRGRNDCAVPGAHSCAGESRLDNDPKSWIYLPVGVCARIAGAGLTPKE